MTKAIEAGIADAWVDFAVLRNEVAIGKVTVVTLRHARISEEQLSYRMAGAVMGIYGNSKLEEMYPVYIEDATKQKLDGARQYTVRFAPANYRPSTRSGR